MKKAVFLAIALALSVSPSLAESVRMYRYFNAEGKQVLVHDYQDVPAEFRPSASAVRIGREEASSAENGEDAAGARTEGPPQGAAEEAAPPKAVEKPQTDTNGVRVDSLNLAPLEDGRTLFTGSVVNSLAETVEKVVVHIEAKTQQGSKVFDFPVKPGGGLSPQESVPLKAILDTPAASLTGYQYTLTWQTKKVVQIKTEPAPAAAEGQPQAAPQEKKKKRRGRGYAGESLQ